MPSVSKADVCRSQLSTNCLGSESVEPVKPGSHQTARHWKSTYVEFLEGLAKQDLISLNRTWMYEFPSRLKFIKPLTWAAYTDNQTRTKNNARRGDKMHESLNPLILSSNQYKQITQMYVKNSAIYILVCSKTYLDLTPDIFEAPTIHWAAQILSNHLHRFLNLFNQANF